MNVSRLPLNWLMVLFLHNVNKYKISGAYEEHNVRRKPEKARIQLLLFIDESHFEGISPVFVPWGIKQ
jgi:hypothetical protein